MDSLPFIEWCLAHLNYFTVAFLMMIESSFIPFPSEIVIPPAAYLAATTGEMDVIGVVMAGTIGATLGALANYYLALFLGRPLIYRFARSRIGALCLLDETKVLKAESYFYRHGGISTFIGRLIPAVRQLISIPAGLSRMRMGKFILYTALGAGSWNIILASLGYYFASFVPREQLLSYVTRYSHEIGYAIMGIVGTVLAFLLYRTLRKPSRPFDSPEL